MAHVIKLKPIAPIVMNQNLYSSKSTCIRHPNHQQSPGVCSVCVNEKLARLSPSDTSNLEPDTIISYSSSVASSYSSSECASPATVRIAKYGKRGSVSFVKRREKEDEAVLSKSRSMAAAFVRRVRGGSGGGGKEMLRSGGFWSKVLKRAKRKKMER